VVENSQGDKLGKKEHMEYIIFFFFWTFHKAISYARRKTWNISEEAALFGMQAKRRDRHLHYDFANGRGCFCCVFVAC